MDRPLKLKPSSQIHDGTYDPQTGRLTVVLNGGVVHAYHSVDPKYVEGLESADSPGKYFHQFIRNAHQTSRVR